MKTVFSQFFTSGVLIAVIVLGATLAIIGVREKQQLEKQQLQELHAIASSFARAIDGDQHTRLAVEYPSRDAIRRGFIPAVYEELAQEFREIEVEQSLGTPLYTLILKPEQKEAIRLNPTKRVAHATEFIITSAPEPYFRHTYDYLPQMGEVFFKGLTATAAPYEDTHGTWISAYAPIKNAQGEVVALLEVDKSLDALYRDLYKNLAVYAGIGLLVFLFTLPIVWLLSRSLVLPMRALAQQAKRLGEGNYHEAVTQTTDIREVHDLGSVLEATRANIIAAIERLVAQEKLASLGTHAAEIVHNLKNPLMVIRGYVDIMREDQPEDERLRRIEEACGRLNAIVSSLLSVSRREQATEIEEIVVEDLLRGELEFLKADQSLAASIKLTLDIDRVPPLKARYVHLSQTFGNLIKNAVEAMHECGTKELRVIARAVTGGVAIEISDTGAGMSEDIRTRIFEPFFTTKPLVSQAGEPVGTGLGLPFCKTMIASYGGTIDVRSELGVGTTFTVILPTV